MRGLIGPSFVAGAPSREGIALTPAPNTEAIRGVDGARTERARRTVDAARTRGERGFGGGGSCGRRRMTSRALGRQFHRRGTRRGRTAMGTPLIASVFDAGVRAMPSRDGAPATKEGPIKPRTIRHHQLWLEGALNQALVSLSLPLLHHADLGYQVCGNGTRAILSHGTTMR